ncbi:hypothetical protein TanjilG_27496 [Lupinus angustifolius]|uniref:Uncharacterized protein n=1 Tax=Lupinus angustifolius TaxID=3871 RepID=A0A4P1R3K3_LUPAN|nr:PREDICTED: nuclear polyadenylated RNA-binding protein 3-like [Lupinus angustifolius]OIW00245.1 hypothetical protein TanjilG_27496 [Lupinus angustifolius]
MGGGNSKLNAGEEVVVPVKIRPLLLRRFEEFRKHRNGGTLKIEGTLSKKELLKDNPGEEDGNSQTSHEHETEIQEKYNEKEHIKEEIMVLRVISIEKISRVVPLPNTECECKCKCETQEEKEENKEEKDTNTERDNQEKVFHVNDVVEVHEDEKTRENEEELDAKSDTESSDDDDDDEESEEHGRLDYPGSPSFRIYCIETENRKEGKEECKNETIVVHKKSASADSIHSTASRISRNSNEATQIVGIESTRKRKGKKKFGAVRTLLKVKSCYHPMSSCTGDDRRHLLVAKMN